MNRREFFTIATTAATASVAGCSGILGGDSGGRSAPEAAAAAYVEAAAAGDSETFQRYTHPEGQLEGGFARGTPSDAAISVASTELREQSDGRATVVLAVRATVMRRGEQQSNTVEYEVDVRQYEGNWRVYDYSQT